MLFYELKIETLTQIKQRILKYIQITLSIWLTFLRDLTRSEFLILKQQFIDKRIRFMTEAKEWSSNQYRKSSFSSAKVPLHLQTTA